MTTRWRRRLVLVAVTAVVACLAMLLLGMHPRVALVGVIVLVVATIAWFTLDVGSLVEEIDWERHADRRDTSARSDRRVNLIRTRLHRERRGADEWASTAAHLADLIDARLRSYHGIDRAADPAAAANVLGPELAAFMNDPDARRRMAGLRSLPATLTLIERL
jgi:hypothetical protein